jgi:hypothetical protein
LQPARAATPQPAVTPLDRSLATAVLTRDGSDTYGITMTGGVTQARTPSTNRGRDTRVIFWQRATDPAADGQTCGTWRSESSDHDQQGAALRVATTAGVTRAITVTKNIFGPNYVFNVHVWDSRARPYPFTQIASFDLRSTFAPHGVLIPLPWSLCAQAFGDTVSFIAWPASEPKPAWGDPHHGGSVTLPQGWDYAGATGWYVGHLWASESASFENLTTGPASLSPTVNAVTAPIGVHAAP